MSWEEFEAPKKKLKANHDVRVSYKTQGSSKPSIRVILSEKIVEQLGWKDEPKFRALIGCGEDAGTIRVIPHSEGLHSMKPIKWGKMKVPIYRIVCGHIAELGSGTHDVEDVDFEIMAATTLQISLPSWGSAAVTQQVRARVETQDRNARLRK